MCALWGERPPLQLAWCPWLTLRCLLLKLKVLFCLLKLRLRPREGNTWITLFPNAALHSPGCARSCGCVSLGTEHRDAPRSFRPQLIGHVLQVSPASRTFDRSSRLSATQWPSEGRREFGGDVVDDSDAFAGRGRNSDRLGHGCDGNQHRRLICSGQVSRVHCQERRARSAGDGEGERISGPPHLRLTWRRSRSFY